MRARRRPIGPGRVALLLLLAAALVAGCSRGDGEIRGSGTIEMDEIDIGSTVGGRVLRVCGPKATPSARATRSPC
jgi:hypothetical protein